MDDTKVLLQDIRRMDAEALAKVFDLYAPAIFQYVFRRCSNATIADQIVGDVFAKLLEQLSQGNGPNSNIRAYLFEMAYHAMVDEIRHSRRMAPIGTVDFLLPVTASTDRAAEEKLLQGILLRAIQSDLTEHQRHVIIFRFLEGFSLKETAQIMGKTVTNIKVT